MSTTIDQKVVEMRFDNKQFEQNVATSMSTLDKLKNALSLKGSAKAAQSEFDSYKSGFISLKDSINKMWSTWEYEIAGRMKNLVKAFTIDPIKTGFSEYETQMNAVQTILANTESKGKTLEDVNGALDELNTYADKTIYNFTEMTRNIGTFTAAGVDLDTSVSAIKGIANLAAVSGSTSQQASTAMYQLSQAMASGKVQLMDWNSIVNAGMGGQVFQDALKETAKVHGVAIDDIISKQGSFRESLSEGWLTTEILTDTLAKFTGDLSEEQLKSQGYTEAQIKEIMKLGQTANDAATKVKTFTQLFDTLKEAAQSGWTQTWEILVGDFEEAKEMLTNVSDVIGEMIGKSAESRNELLENWKVLGGREDVINSISNVFHGLIDVIKPIKDAFRDIFPPITAERLKAITQNLEDLTSKFKIGDKTADNLKRTFKGLFAIVDIVIQVFKSAFKAAGSLFGSFGDLGGGILGATASLGDWLVGLSELIESSGILDKIFGGIADVIKAALKGVTSFVKFIKEKFVLPGWTLFKDVLEDIFSSMGGVGEAAGSMTTLVVSAFEKMGEALDNCGFVVLLKGTWNVIKTIAAGITKVFGSLISGVIDAFSNVGFGGIFEFINGLLSGGLLLGLIKFVKSIGDITDGFGDIIENLGGCLEGFQQKLKAEALMKIAGAVAILTAALLVLSLIDREKLFTATATITTLFAELIVATSLLSKIEAGKGMIKASRAIGKLASALLILSIAMKIISTMSWEEMSIGLVGVTGGLAALVIAVNLLPEKKVKNAAAAVKKLSTALVILALALKIMGTMSWNELAVGLVATVVGLAALVAAANLLPKDMVLRSLGIVSLATALLIMSGALKIMSTMSWDEIARGLTALAGTMAILVISMNLMKKALPGAAAMFIVAPALITLSGALMILGNMSLNEIGRGLLALGGSMAILAVSLNLMKKTIAGSVALVIATSALAVLAPVLMLLGSMSWKAIAKGLVSLAGAFAVVGIAGLLLQPLIPALLGLGAAMALVGVGILAAGVGLAAFGAGLSALAIGITAIVGSLAAIMSGIIGIIKAIIVGIAEGIVAACSIITKGAPTIAEAIIAVIRSLCDLLIECVPMLADTLLQLVVGLLKALAKYTPQLVSGLFDFILAILNGIAEHIPELIKAVANIFMSIFTGAVEALSEIDSGALIQGVLAIGLMTALVAALAAISSLIPAAMVGVVGLGIVVAELAIVLAALGALAQIPGLIWLVNEGGDFLQAVGTAIGKFIGGIAGGIAQGFTSSLPQIGSDLSLFMSNLQPFIDGVKQIDESVVSGVKSLVGVVLAITAANVLEGLTSWLTGGSSISSFAAELPLLGQGLKGFSDSVAGVVPENIIAAANAAKALADMTSAIPNEGGVVSWFVGENSISKFASELPTLGLGLKGFSDAVMGIVPENITAAANAAKVLADMTSTIPNEGGVKSWFAGDNSISKFASDIVTLGHGLKGFSDAVVGIVPENVTASANAAKALADMTSAIPNEGGVKAWFMGESSVSKFAGDLVTLGQGLKGFSDATLGVNPETMTASANAAKALADMTAAIPNEGGVKAWFAGETSVSKFSGDLVNLGKGLKGFSDSTAGINPETLTAAAGSAKSLAEMTQSIPKEGGIKAWFSGETSIANFSDKLPSLGKGLKGFSDSVVGINPENVTAAANAAKSLAQMTDTVPKDTDKIVGFGTNLTKFGTSLSAYFESTKGITAEAASASTNAVNSVKDIASIDSGKIAAVSTSIDDVTKSIKNLSKVPKDSVSSFSKALKELGDKGAESLVDAFDDLDDDLKKKAKSAMDSFVEGIESKKSAAKKACTGIATACVTAIGDKSSAFKSAGKNLASSFAAGISENTFKAEAKAKAMADAAEKAAKEALDINSPSKVFRALGYSVPEGFAVGIDKLAWMASDSSVAMTDQALDSVKNGISRIADAVNSDIDVQPTIHPVLDLSDVKSGARKINSLIGTGALLGVMTNVGAINSTMGRNGQNGANDDIVDEIIKLRKELANGDRATYNINGVTVSGEDGVEEAFRTILRAAKIDRRI